MSKIQLITIPLALRRFSKSTLMMAILFLSDRAICVDLFQEEKFSLPVKIIVVLKQGMKIGFNSRLIDRFANFYDICRSLSSVTMNTLEEIQK